MVFLSLRFLPPLQCNGGKFLLRCLKIYIYHLKPLFQNHYSFFVSNEQHIHKFHSPLFWGDVSTTAQSGYVKTFAHTAETICMATIHTFGWTGPLKSAFFEGKCMLFFSNVPHQTHCITSGLLSKPASLALFLGGKYLDLKWRDSPLCSPTARWLWQKKPLWRDPLLVSWV